MAKGKYGTRALNRSAAIDNDVIAELRGQLNVARSETQDLRQRLAVAEGRSKAEVMREAGKLAQEEVEAARARVEAAEKGAEHALADAGIQAWKLFKKYECQVGRGYSFANFVRDYMPIFGIDDLFHDLMRITQGHEVALTRVARRRSIKDVIALDSKYKQAAARNGVLVDGTPQ